MFNREAQPQSHDEGRRQPQTPAPPIPGRQAEERRAVAWVGKSVVFKGELTSVEDMTIDGRVEGSITVRDNSLTIGPDAHIRADITARVVIILGAVKGTVTAHERVDVRETGSVEGDMFSPHFVIAEGAVLCGRVDTEARHEDVKV